MLINHLISFVCSCDRGGREAIDLRELATVRILLGPGLRVLELQLQPPRQAQRDGGGRRSRGGDGQERRQQVDRGADLVVGEDRGGHLEDPGDDGAGPVAVRAAMARDGAGGDGDRRQDRDPHLRGHQEGDRLRHARLTLYIGGGGGGGSNILLIVGDGEGEREPWTWRVCLSNRKGEKY